MLIELSKTITTFTSSDVSVVDFKGRSTLDPFGSKNGVGVGVEVGVGVGVSILPVPGVGVGTGGDVGIGVGSVCDDFTTGLNAVSGAQPEIRVIKKIDKRRRKNTCFMPQNPQFLSQHSSAAFALNPQSFRKARTSDFHSGAF